MVGVEVKGVLVCDKNGLTLASKYRFILSILLLKFCFSIGKDVSVSPGPIARLAELAASLSGRRTTVCLENTDA
jgi:hypothetical protein